MKLKMYVLAVALVVLAGCSSAPKSPYSTIDQEYFDAQEVKYSNVDITVTSTKESKAVDAGYMSSEEISNYVKGKVIEDLTANDIYADEGLNVQIDLIVDRVYHFTVSSKMAGWKFSAEITVLKGEEILASYNESGNLVNTAFGSAFKDFFGEGNAAKETIYIDKAIEYMLSDLPQRQ